jgi:hypothetical protein
MAKKQGTESEALRKTIFTRSGTPVTFAIDGMLHQIPGGYSTFVADYVDKLLTTPQAKLIGVLTDEEVLAKEKKEKDEELARIDAELAAKKVRDEEIKVAKKALADAQAKYDINEKELARKGVVEKIAIANLIIKERKAEIQELESALKVMDGDVKGDK